MLAIIEITPWHWAGFIACVLFFLALDLGVFHRHAHVVRFKEALAWTSVWVTLSLLFAALLVPLRGKKEAVDFVTGYIIELSLSMDNVFVIAMIFSYFAIPRLYQHRVLFWGILGVIVLRAIMIGLGTALVQRFDWVLYIFGAFLLFSGIRMFFSKEQEKHPDLSQNPLLRFLRRHVRVTDELHEGRFLVRLPDSQGGKALLYATPLLIALILIELADLVFAVDSVPAVLAISQDPFIVYTSNIFAILGLRALYFALAALMHRFIYLKYALALVLSYIGAKIFLHELIKVPALLSLGVTLGLLGGGVVLSLLHTRRKAPAA